MASLFFLFPWFATKKRRDSILSISAVRRKEAAAHSGRLPDVCFEILGSSLLTKKQNVALAHPQDER